MKLIYVIKINYDIPMYAEKSFWIQHCLEASHTSAKSVRFASHVEPNISCSRLYPLNILNPYQHNLLTCFYGQSLQELSAAHRLLTFIEPCASTQNSRSSQVQSNLQALRPKWLEQ